MKTRVEVELETGGMDDDPILTTSLEEDVMIQEANDAANRVDVMLNEAERTAQISEAMGDAAIVMKSEDVVTPREANLITMVSQAATAGSMASPDSVVPSVESFVGKQGHYSSEAFQDTANKLVQGILKIIKRIWIGIKQFYKNYMGQTIRLKRSVNKLKDRYKSITENSIEPTIPYDPHQSSLQVGNKPVNTASELIKYYNTTYQVLEFATQYVPAGVLTIGESLKKAITTVDSNLKSASQRESSDNKELYSKAVDESVKSIIGVFSNITNRMKSTFPGSTSKYDELIGFDVTTTPELLGNVSMMAMLPHGTQTSDVPIDRVRNAGIQIYSTVSQDPEFFREHPYGTPTKQEILALFKTTDSIVDVLERGKNDINELERLSNSVAKASEDLSKTAGNGIHIGNVSDMSSFRELMNFNTSLAKWCSDPAISAQRYAARTASAVLVVVDRALAAHGV